MNEKRDISQSVATVPSGVDDAVGVEKSKWFIAIVNHRSEKVAAERLSKLGIENYLPTQTVVRIWKNGKKAKVENVVIPAVVFVYCTESRRKEIISLPFISRFMTNKAGSTINGGNKPLATVSEDEINCLKFMLGQIDVPVTITQRPYVRGERVKVVRGSLAGLEGEVIDVSSSKSILIVNLDFLGCANLTIASINIEKI